jgi:hypothetical protein
MRVVDNSCGGVCRYVLPSQKPDRGEGEDGMIIECVERRGFNGITPKSGRKKYWSGQSSERGMWPEQETV